MTHHCLVQFRYGSEQAQALIDSPSDRAQVAKAFVAAFGGKLLQLFFAYGEYDGIFIAEFPDRESMSAALMTMSGTGGFAAIHTTILFSMDEAMAAMRRAAATDHGQAPPGG